MTGDVFLVILLAALLHAGWNAVVKGSADKHGSMAAVVIGHVPPAVLCLPFAALPDPACLPHLVAGIALHFGYQMFLLNSYRFGDLSQVYPLARGSAPLMVAVVSGLFLGVVFSEAEVLAVLLIACGIISLALVRRQDGLRNGRAAALALITGGFIAAYSLNDGLGARVAGTSLGFYVWLALGNGVLWVIYGALVRPGALRVLAPGVRRSFLLGGGASFAAYALVTWAFTQAPIALVTALRETSIVFALLIGVLVFREPLSLRKLLATMATLGGAVILRFAR